MIAIPCHVVPPHEDRLFQSPRARFYTTSAPYSMGRLIPSQPSFDKDKAMEFMIKPDTYVVYFLWISAAEQYIVATYADDGEDVVDIHEVLGFEVTESEDEKYDIVDIDFANVEIDDKKIIKRVKNIIGKLL